MVSLMVILLLKLNFSKMEKKEKEEKKKDDLLTCMASPQVKISFVCLHCIGCAALHEGVKKPKHGVTLPSLMRISTSPPNHTHKLASWSIHVSG